MKIARLLVQSLELCVKYGKTDCNAWEFDIWCIWSTFRLHPDYKFVPQANWWEPVAEAEVYILFMHSARAFGVRILGWKNLSEKISQQLFCKIGQRSVGILVILGCRASYWIVPSGVWISHQKWRVRMEALTYLTCTRCISENVFGLLLLKHMDASDFWACLVWLYELALIDFCMAMVTVTDVSLSKFVYEQWFCKIKRTLGICFVTSLISGYIETNPANPWEISSAIFTHSYSSILSGHSDLTHRSRPLFQMEPGLCSLSGRR